MLPRDRQDPVPRAVLHPEAGAEWFKALPHERRARMNREWREALERDRALLTHARRRPWTGAWKQAVVFGLFDALCPLSDVGTIAAAVLGGAVLGALLNAFRADRLASAVAGGFAFVLFELLSRGGITAAHLFWIMPATAFSAYLGLEREE